MFFVIWKAGDEIWHHNFALDNEKEYRKKVEYHKQNGTLIKAGKRA